PKPDDEPVIITNFLSDINTTPYLSNINITKKDRSARNADLSFLKPWALSPQTPTKLLPA
ncbi:hypothetical protein NR224_10425, partial [Pediococcus ethanolidurans]|uniref:hypothetical protein n=1 Tax=Pediococcus ethanolidurans TaxID=319653 RepID=UPI0021E71785